MSRVLRATSTQVSSLLRYPRNNRITYPTPRLDIFFSKHLVTGKSLKSARSARAEHTVPREPGRPENTAGASAQLHRGSGKRQGIRSDRLTSPDDRCRVAADTVDILLVSWKSGRSKGPGEGPGTGQLMGNGRRHHPRYFSPCRQPSPFRITRAIRRELLLLPEFQTTLIGSNHFVKQRNRGLRLLSIFSSLDARG